MKAIEGNRLVGPAELVWPPTAGATRTVTIGGVPKEELLARLQNAGVRFNEAALALFADDRFTTASSGSTVDVVEVSAAGLGLTEGATFAGLVEAAAERGLSLCPLELGPWLRLQFLDQPEGFTGHPAAANCAPPGSVPVASAPLAANDETPKGFYLRRIEGVPWLRGYRASPDYKYQPHDVFVFLRPGPATGPGVAGVTASRPCAAVGPP
jgi:hypothetical protein